MFKYLKNWFHNEMHVILMYVLFSISLLQSTSAGQELLDNVFKHLNLIETAYFGLRYIDSTGQTVINFRFFVFRKLLFFVCDNINGQLLTAVLIISLHV